MEQIDPSQKVAGLLKRHPQTYHIFYKYGCPDMRKGFFSFMARVMSIRSAARIHKIPLEKLVNDLETSINHPESHTKLNT